MALSYTLHKSKHLFPFEDKSVYYFNIEFRSDTWLFGHFDITIFDNGF